VAQQQLWLIILAALIIAMGIAVGHLMFRDTSSSVNRDAVITDLVNLAARAQQYYRIPGASGGGHFSFTGLTISRLTANPTNANGSFVVTSVSPTQVVLDGTGVEGGNDGSPISVTITVFADSTAVRVNN